MTDSGKCAFVLGIELLDGTDSSVILCQRRYVNDILKRFNMDECKTVASPVDVSSRLFPSNATTKISAPFREAVGALMHLSTATRPDITYAVSYVSRFMENPQDEHWVHTHTKLMNLLSVPFGLLSPLAAACFIMCSVSGLKQL